MAKALAIEILDYANELEAVGVSKEQAEKHARLLAKITDEHLATKQDINAIKKELSHLEAVLASKIGAIETKLNWLMALIGVVGTLLGMINIIHHLN